MQGKLAIPILFLASVTAAQDTHRYQTDFPAEELAQRSGAELCGLVGHTVILYRPHPEEPKLELPK